MLNKDYEIIMYTDHTIMKFVKLIFLLFPIHKTNITAITPTFIIPVPHHGT